MKKIKKILSGAMTAASILTIILALGVVDVTDLTLTPFIAMFLAGAWITHMFRKAERNEHHRKWVEDYVE